ncbi:SDR family oxidoreductase [Microbacterium sp. SA39]|uniref:SDR family oxidoreductase n=1 Tax=Microbacterium sp. SA39 TaxID=1263625 RepID=UPI0005F9C140|nr:SDR family oxidoreductase [Microbacterium sp. SA39]KJQ52886.1 Glucose 1-dehydrogenase 4 [Microbacterium sp. SA39]
MTVNFGLNGRVAFVTGGASGIGLAIAVGIGEQGGAVGLFDRAGAAFDDAVAAVESVGGRAIALAGDVTDKRSLDEALEGLSARFGTPSLAVNAAGIANAAPAEEMSVEQWTTLYDVDVTGVFLSCQAEAQVMLDRRITGSIVNIASMSGRIANRGLMQAHYNSAKAAVVHLSRSLAVEWAERGIRVNALSPGYTATPMNTRPEMVDRMKTFAEQVPMQRVAEPHEMAGPAIFLLSDAASYVTGIDLLADGGHCAW